MLVAVLLPMAATSAFIWQALPPPPPVLMSGDLQIPREEFVQYVAKCKGVDVEVRYRVSRIAGPIGSTVYTIKGNDVPLAPSMLTSLNSVLKERFITEVSAYSCYATSDGVSKINLWLEVDAVGGRKEEASHIVLNITGDKANIILRRRDGNISR